MLSSAFSCFILDRDCEIYDIMRPYANQIYDNFATLDVPDNALVVIGRTQAIYNVARLREHVAAKRATYIFCNAAEGSSTIRWHMEIIGFGDLARSKQLPVITGGDMPWFYENLPFQDFLLRMFANRTNLASRLYIDKIFDNKPKPYQFLFLNGRSRSHRKFLIEYFDKAGLLDKSIWSCLEGAAVSDRTTITYVHNGIDLLKINRPVQFLPEHYEIAQHRSRLGQLPSDGTTFAKYHLFNGIWADAELTPEAYWDSYFSVVTETVFEDAETFLTEKIWKPILIGHPWIAVSNAGIYRSLHNMGFKSFNPIIDESFDNITDPQRRIERIARVVTELCRSDLSKFLDETRSICKYNQEHMFELFQKYTVEFPAEFFNFVSRFTRV